MTGEWGLNFLQEQRFLTDRLDPSQSSVQKISVVPSQETKAATELGWTFTAIQQEYMELYFHSPQILVVLPNKEHRQLCHTKKRKAAYRMQRVSLHF